MLSVTTSQVERRRRGVPVTQHVDKDAAVRDRGGMSMNRADGCSKCEALSRGWSLGMRA